MAHAPECHGRIYGCPKCGTRGLTIEQTFKHDCPAHGDGEPVAAAPRLKLETAKLAPGIEPEGDGWLCFHSSVDGARRRYCLWSRVVPLSA
jgi:hypothetical protein